MTAIQQQLHMGPDDVSLVRRRGVEQPEASGRAELTDRGRLALRLPPERYVSDVVTIYPGEAGCGLELAGDPAGLTWLEAGDALALARGILAHLDPDALRPRVLSLHELRPDASRAEVMLAARRLVAEEQKGTPHNSQHRLERFAHGLLERVNATLAGLGFRPGTLEELL